MFNNHVVFMTMQCLSLNVNHYSGDYDHIIIIVMQSLKVFTIMCVLLIMWL